MEMYTVLVVLLFLLAFIDLIVGVSNDAVNFLNSAIGSRVASYRVILLVASAGILLGSTFSEGIMEVARSGIFNPAFFTFDKVMIIFIAVMLTDILLLDVYNTFGLPTSTTVSIVFELLGASCFVALMIISERGLGIESMGEFINVRSAVTIIIGIFLSVGIAFLLGAIVQYITRLMFSFNMAKSLRNLGGVFSGIAISTIIYFLLIKGAKGSSIISAEQNIWIQEHTVLILSVCFVFFSALAQALLLWRNINPLRIVVLLGTFALAMAFAGNDLVNFIGVAIAGFQSLQAWTASGSAPGSYTMEVLLDQVVTPTYLLLASGIVMMLTIWTNAKSRKVTETEVSLGRQDEGDERFAANRFSRSIVGAAISVGDRLNGVLPGKWLKWVNKRFNKRYTSMTHTYEQPSFDLLRASVNLLVASALIALGTSKKLPLSTTFVTFMVAMGSSFADQAWGRDSAVYRVAGVVNVITGWFVTAGLAFITSALVAAIVYHTGFAGIVVITILVGVFLYWSYRFFNQRAEEEKKFKDELEVQVMGASEMADQVKINTSRNLKTVFQAYKASRELLSGKKEKQKDVVRNLQKLEEQNDKLNRRIIRNIRTIEKTQLSAARFNILLFDLMQDLFQSAGFLYAIADKHVQNHHPVPSKAFQAIMKRLEDDMNRYLELIILHIQEADFSADTVQVEKQNFLKTINDSIDGQIIDIQRNETGNRLSLLQTRFLLESKDIAESAYEVFLLYREFSVKTAKTMA